MQAVKAQARAEAADAVASEGSSTTHPKKGALDWVWATETLLHRQGCAAWTTVPPAVSTRQWLGCRQLLPPRPQHNTTHHTTPQKSNTRRATNRNRRRGTGRGAAGAAGHTGAVEGQLGGVRRWRRRHLRRVWRARRGLGVGRLRPGQGKQSCWETFCTPSEQSISSTADLLQQRPARAAMLLCACNPAGRSDELQDFKAL